jgi:hypothetical protein
MAKQQKKHSWKKLLWISAASALVLSSYAYAKTPLKAIASGRVEGDYARLSFEWPERVRFSTKSSGNRLTLTFDKPTDASVGGIMQSLSPIITKAEKSSDGRSFTFTLDRVYKTRTFMSGNVAGIDLLGVTSKAKKSTQPLDLSEKAVDAIEEVTDAPKPKPAALKKDKSPKKTTDKVAEKTAKPIAKKADVKKDSPVKIPVIAKTVEPKKPDALLDNVDKAEKVNEPELETVKAQPSETKIIQLAPVAPTSTAPETPVIAAGKADVQTKTDNIKTENIPTIEPAASADKKDVVIKTVETIPAAPPKNIEPNVVKALNIPEGPSIRFAMNERIAAAVFSRENVLWVVFNKPVPIDINAINQSLPELLTVAQQLPDTAAPGMTVLRFIQKAPVFPVVYKEPGSFDWIVSFAKRPTRPYERIRVSLSTEPPLKPHVVLPVLETADPVSIADPLVGDSIQVTTVYKPGAGLTPERDFVEFTLLSTAQGVAVVPLNDTTRTTPMRNGLKITTADGVTLSPDLPRLAMDEIPDNAISGDTTLFPYAQWKLKNENDFIKERQRLTAQASREQGDNANFARLKLLQLLLTEAMFHESIGLADEIRNRDPVFYASEKVSALRGAANFMLYRLQDANKDFASAELADIPEIGLWKNAIAEMSGDPLKTFDYLAYNDSFISKYPPAFRQKLSIIAGDFAVNRQDYNTPIKIFDTLNKDKILQPIQGYVDFMFGKISAESAKEDDVANAIRLWTGLTQNLSDRFLRARAEFSLVNLLLRQGKIERKEAIDRLDRLRIVWRGDGLELNLLLLLGNLYLDKKMYPEAMRTYREVVTYYPDSPEALPTAQKMSETFRKLYNDGVADSMPPLKALALFYEFRQHTPIEAEGDRMIRNLADRLISVDLLSRAAGLLDHQVRYRLQKEDRSRVGARLALVYLLNRQPKEALNTLELTGYGQNPVELQRTRNQLAAAAMTATGEYDKALAVLEGDLSNSAMRARLNVYWGKKDWTNLVPVAESILSSRNDPTQPLDTNETEALLKLATAYAYERDAAQLKYLSDYFTPLMRNNPSERTFRFITKGSDPVDVKNIAQINQDVGSIQDYLSSYRSQVAKGGLSSVVQ